MIFSHSLVDIWLKNYKNSTFNDFKVENGRYNYISGTDGRAGNPREESPGFAGQDAG